MITTISTVDQITITDNGIILYREQRRIFENGVLISQIPHRSSLMPGADLSGVPANVAAIATFVWTPEVLSAWEQQYAQAKSTEERNQIKAKMDENWKLAG